MGVHKSVWHTLHIYTSCLSLRQMLMDFVSSNGGCLLKVSTLWWISEGGVLNDALLVQVQVRAALTRKDSCSQNTPLIIIIMCFEHCQWHCGCTLHWRDTIKSFEASSSSNQFIVSDSYTNIYIEITTWCSDSLHAFIPFIWSLLCQLNHWTSETRSLFARYVFVETETSEGECGK